MDPNFLLKLQLQGSKLYLYDLSGWCSRLHQLQHLPKNIFDRQPRRIDDDGVVSHYQRRIFARSVATVAFGDVRERLLELRARIVFTLFSQPAFRSFGDPHVVSTQIEIVRRAAAEGIQVKRIVFSHPRPFHAAFEVLRDQKIGLLVFGPDRKRYGRFRFRRHAAKFRRDAPCLVWPYE